MKYGPFLTGKIEHFRYTVNSVSDVREGCCSFFWERI